MVMKYVESVRAQRSPFPVPTREILIPARQSQIPRPETACKLQHLKRITDYLMPYNDNLDVSLLLGINCVCAIKPKEIIPENDDMKRTALGWGIIGMTAPNATGNDNGVRVNRIISREVPFSPRKICHFTLKTHTREILTPARVNHLFQLDFNGPRLAGQALSHKDRTFIMSNVSMSIHQRCNGHYEMPLLFKRESVALPDNNEVHVAHNRLSRLKRRLKTDSKYWKDYLA